MKKLIAIFICLAIGMCFVSCGEENATGDLTNPWKLTVAHFSSDRVRQKIEEYNQRGEANPGKRGFTPIRLSEEGLETLEAVASVEVSVAGVTRCGSPMMSGTVIPDVEGVTLITKESHVVSVAVSVKQNQL